MLRGEGRWVASLLGVYLTREGMHHGEEGNGGRERGVGEERLRGIPLLGCVCRGVWVGNSSRGVVCGGVNTDRGLGARGRRGMGV